MPTGAPAIAFSLLPLNREQYLVEGARMMNSLRPLVAAALLMAIGTSKAAAQTVMVRHVPAGETVEVFLNATKVATAVVEASGDTSLPLNLRDNNATKTELEANIF